MEYITTNDTRALSIIPIGVKSAFLPKKEFIQDFSSETPTLMQTSNSITKSLKTDPSPYILEEVSESKEDISTISFIRQLRERNKKLLGYLDKMYADSDPETDKKAWEAVKESLELYRVKDNRA